MIKTINYFLQALVIYIFFIIGRILGIKISRIIFSFLFSSLGPFFKSKKIIKKNLEFFSKDIADLEKDKIISDMWKNYGMTFIEYIFLDHYRKNKSHIIIEGEANLSTPIKKKISHFCIWPFCKL